MDNEKRIENLPAEKYQELFGGKKKTFDAMLEILQADDERKHQRGGRPPKLGVLDQLMIMLQYDKEYRTMAWIAFDYDVSKSTVCEAIQWVENTLMHSGLFDLPSKRALLADDSPEVVIVDVTECEIERPKKAKTIRFRQKEETYAEAADGHQRKDEEEHLYCGLQRKYA